MCWVPSEILGESPLGEVDPMEVPGALCLRVHGGLLTGTKGFCRQRAKYQSPRDGSVETRGGQASWGSIT